MHKLESDRYGNGDEQPVQRFLELVLEHWLDRAFQCILQTSRLGLKIHIRRGQLAERSSIQIRASHVLHLRGRPVYLSSAANKKLLLGWYRLGLCHRTFGT